MCDFAVLCDFTVISSNITMNRSLNRPDVIGHICKDCYEVALYPIYTLQASPDNVKHTPFYINTVSKNSEAQNDEI